MKSPVEGELKCPRCNGIEFDEIDSGQDDYDSYAWTSYRCKGCSLWYSGWTGKWYTIDSWQDEEPENEYYDNTRTCLKCSSHNIENFYIFNPVVGKKNKYVCQSCGNSEQSEFDIE